MLLVESGASNGSCSSCACHRSHEELLKVNLSIAIGIGQLDQAFYFLGASICTQKLPKQPLELGSANISIFIYIDNVKGFPQLRYLLVSQRLALLFFGFSNCLLPRQLSGASSILFDLFNLLGLFLEIWICEEQHGNALHNEEQDGDAPAHCVGQFPREVALL